MRTRPLIAVNDHETGWALRSAVVRRLSGSGLDAATRTALLHFVDHDAAAIAAKRQIALAFTELTNALGAEPPAAELFRAAWTLMYAAASRLDALQDDDPVDAPLPVAPAVPAQYNFVFAVYVLAAALLDALPPELPAGRVKRLRRLWSDTMLRMASGQQQDLAGADADAADPLAHYQALAQAKTGASFALAFGGLALLLAEDEELIAALTGVGELYGTLLQYSDDLCDVATQPNLTVTLPGVLEQVAGHGASARLATSVWAQAYDHHRQQAVALLAPYPALQRTVADLFQAVFAPAPEPGLADG